MIRVYQVTVAEHLSNGKDEKDPERIESTRTVSLHVAVEDGGVEEAIKKFKDQPPANGVGKELIKDSRVVEVRLIVEAV